MFKPVTSKVDFPERERRILDWWSKSGIIKKYLHKNDKSSKKFSFLDGPITANNPMGVHHAWGRTHKDLWQRFFNMKGYRERFQNGFDNQGLWVEVEVEKELGFKNKKEIEKYGIEKFVEKCKERTLKFAKIQTEQSKRLGYFMDWEHSYYTMSDENNYMIWHFLKKCWQDGNLYKGRDSVPWCPRCGTAISQHEILTEDYKEAIHDSIYMEYPIKGRKNEFLLVWTTTPWTLPGNVAVAVDADKDYIIATGSVKGNKYYLNEYAAKRLGLKIERAIRGSKLVGLKYESPFDDLPKVKKSLGKYLHGVVATNTQILPISEEEGTGLVHVAPGAGSEDFHLGKKLNLPVIELINEESYYISDLGEFSGKNAKDHPEIIIDFLKKNKEGFYLFDVSPYVHRYPACWRCKTELVWRVVDEWYVAMDNKSHQEANDYRSRMIKITKNISWLPSWGLERELDWLANMQDWLISKKRYWGLALPIWECSCGHFELIGSKEELKEKAVSGWEEFEGHSPHRPWIDKVKIKCSQCGKVVNRISDVGNPWLDAGIVSFSTLNYQTDKKYWQEWFPADFITESFPGQFKNWFYSLLAMATVLEDSNPFKTVLGFATLLAEDGRPMHKSLGNAIEFNEGADKIGVDVMRWMYVTQNPADNLLFGYHKADEVRRRFHLMLWNIYNFFVTYANIDKFKSQKSAVKSQNVLDRWILSRLNQLIQTVTQSLEKYDAFTASHAIEDFVNDLSTWYVRRSRDRIGPTAPDGKDKNACYQTLDEVLVTLTKILAPFTPFLAEEIYKNLTGEESVHLEDWPEPDLKKIDEPLEKEIKLARQVVESAHSQRKEKAIRVRQPLSSLATIVPMNLSSGTATLVMDEVNVKELNIKVDESIKAGESLIVKLDTKLTPKLKAEGEARELVRQVQELRKEKGCRLDEKIVIYCPSWPKEFENEIKKQTLAVKLIQSQQTKIVPQ